jgi:hypothetical protein
MRNDDPFADLIRSLEESLNRENRGGSGNEPPPPNRQYPTVQGNPRPLLWLAGLLLLLFLFSRSFGFITDWIWYNSVDFGSVFMTRYRMWFQLFLAGFVISWLFLVINIIIARRLEPAGLTDSPIERFAEGVAVRISQLVLIASIILAIFIGLNVASRWEEILLYFNQSPFGLTDQLFQQDVSFFLFTLPVWQMARGWLTLISVVTLASVGAVNGLLWRGWRAGKAALIHMSLLVALILLLVAWQYRLNAYELVYSRLGVVFGVGYTDANARIPAYNLLALVTVVAAVVVVVMAATGRGWRTMLGVLGAWLAIAFLAGSLYPGLVQRFQVSPNELNLERSYIAKNIEFTRKAYALDQIKVQPYEAATRLTANTLLTESETVSNVRLWDYRPLLQTYNQVQALTQYYAFNDVDIDRYIIDGERRQVMLAARELVPDRLNETAQTWVNRKLVYTHGYGVAMSPVAEITTDGLPEFFLRDLPVQGSTPISQPQIYFGELANDYVIVRTNQPEFDYPQEAGNVTTRFEADSGISMGFLNRLLFAIHFADINLVLNSDIQSDSKLLWRRNIVERIRMAAPFLRFDADPYIVVGEDGHLYWMLDAYTVSSRFPYSEPLQDQPINYIRNSVKIVTNAYNGKMTFYLVDENEPIAAAYSRIFPQLFTPYSAMPEFLKTHVRYPEGLFSVQADVYRTYHMTNPEEFYNKEDLWAWPEEMLQNESSRVQPYYVLMQLPGSDELDFVLILPFTPANRENMIAWLAAQNDPPKYGQKLVFEFGKDTLFFGPKQIEARIDQDPEISQQLTLWNQQGSSVIRGNLLVLPIADSLLYVEPIYLQAATGRIPELKRVVLATADRVVMADNLGQALVKLLGRGVLADERLAALAVVRNDAVLAEERGPSPTGQSAVAVDLSQASLEELISKANQQYEQAQSALRNSDWGGYGSEIEALKATLDQLAKMAGVATPTATPTPAQPETAPAEAQPAETTPTQP